MQYNYRGVFRTFEYRLRPTRKQRRQLMACLAESRHLYNEMLRQVRDYHSETGSFLFKYSLSARFKGSCQEHVPATTVQTLADRLDKAIRWYLARKKRGERVGFPRFKSANRWHSIQLRQWGKRRDVWVEDGRLRVPGKLGKSIKLKQHRPLEGKPKTAHLMLRADGEWYVLIVCDLGDPPLTSVDNPDVGLDVGLNVFLADSEGNTVGNPRCYRKSQKKLRKAQRKICRREKGSKRYKKAARSVARTHLKIARQRKNFLHEIAKIYADNYGCIFVEDLNISGMLRNPISRRALPTRAGLGLYRCLSIRLKALVLESSKSRPGTQRRRVAVVGVSCLSRYSSGCTCAIPAGT